MRLFDDDERRARLGSRQFLAANSSHRIEDVAGGLVGLHATDPATVFLSLRARVPGVSVEDVEAALYDDRTLLKVLAMRRTMFVVPLGLVPVLQASCTDAVAAQQRKRLVTELTKAGVSDDAVAWIEAVLADTLAAVDARGHATGAQLSTDVPALRQQVGVVEGKKWGGGTAITTRVLTVLSAEGHIVRGRPRGSLISSQYEWVRTESWLGAPFSPVPAEEARVDLVRRWLHAFGPGTVEDVKWWTGWSLGMTRSALAALDLMEVELDGGATGLLLAEDAEPVDAPPPWVALLPALDATAMGWTGRDWYLGEHGPALFDRNGNIGPTVWCDGRIVGGWAQRRSGEVAWRLLEKVGSEAVAAIEADAAVVSEWLGAIRVTPRFRTPLDRQLSA